MRKRRLGESSVGKAAGLVHVWHKDASIRAEIYLGTLCGKEGRLGEMNDIPEIGLPVNLAHCKEQGQTPIPGR